MDGERPASGNVGQRFDERLFGEQLGSLRGRTRPGAYTPPPELRYTVFVVQLLWAAVIVPFLAGAVCALLVGS